MKVRAKFFVKQINLFHYGQTKADQHGEVILSPVYESGDAINKTWARATPSGEIKMTITNPDALAAFDLGKSYFVDFMPAD